jgi:hypothetical protein
MENKVMQGLVKSKPELLNRTNDAGMIPFQQALNQTKDQKFLCALSWCQR